MDIRIYKMNLAISPLPIKVLKFKLGLNWNDCLDWRGNSIRDPNC